MADMARDSTNELLIQFDGNIKVAGNGSIVHIGDNIFGQPLAGPKFGSGCFYSNNYSGLTSPNPVGTVVTTPGAGWERREAETDLAPYFASWNTWTTVTSSSAYSGGAAKRGDSDPAMCCFNFTGDRLRIVGTAVSNGASQIYIRIDDKMYKFSAYRSSTQQLTNLFEITGLEEREHLCYIHKTGASVYFYIDALDLAPGAQLLPLRYPPGLPEFRNYLGVYSPLFSLGTSDFTIGWWEYIANTVPQYQVEWYFPALDSGNQHPLIWGYISGTNKLLRASSPAMTAASGNYGDISKDLTCGAVTTGAWVYYEIGRSGNTIRIFKNGAIQRTITTTLSFESSQSCYFNSDYSWQGDYYIDEWYLIRGTCLHNAAFTPPTTAKVVDWTSINLTGAEVGVQEGTVLAANSAGVEVDLLRGDVEQSASPGAHIGELESYLKQGSKIGVQIETAFRGVKDSNRRGLYIPDTLGIGARQSRTYKGVLAEKTIATLRNQAEYEGFEITPTLPTAEANNRYKLTVTATHQYRSRSVNVHSEAGGYPLTGKTRLLIGGAVAIPYPAGDGPVNVTDYTVTSGMLETGVNDCRLQYLYPDGGSEFLDFQIVKEEVQRTVVERTFKDYDGGYTGDRFNPSESYLSANYPCILVPELTSNTTIKTTDYTSIPLSRYTAIQGAIVDGSGLRILASFDKGANWKSFISNAWQTVDIANIASAGMSETTLNAITLAQWGSIFKATAIDFAIYMDNLLSNYAADELPVLAFTGTVATSGTTTYTVPAGYALNKTSYDIFGFYQSSGGTPGWGHAYYAELKNGTWVNVANSYGTAIVAAPDYTSLAANARPAAVRTTVQNDYGYSHQWLKYVYISPLKSYLKSISLQITPSLKVGYAFIM